MNKTKAHDHNTSNIKDLGSMDGDFIYVSEFDDHAAQEFYARFLEIEENPNMPIIPVIINSYGGEISGLNLMRDLIKTSDKPTATIILGKAMSAGAALAVCGHKGLRFCSPNSLIMIHEASGGMIGKSAEIESHANMLKFLNKQFLDNIALDIGISRAKLDKIAYSDRNADKYITAQEAKALKIVDEIGVPRFKRVGPQIHVDLKQFNKKS
jgi:ATP-dependent Clp protease protease subunit